MNEDLAVLSVRLQELCEQAVRETDPENQTRLSAEIYRIITERDRIRDAMASKTD